MEVQVVTDNDYLYEFNHSFVKTDSWGLMHNKFCIVDGKKLSTGSMNPTNNGAFKNDNNLLLIDSKVLARNYEDEFQEMWNGTYKKGKHIKNPVVNIGNITLKNYFCPEDDCAEKVKEELKKAAKTIHFMTFSFTHEGIGNILLLKNKDGVEVKGVMEARQVTKYSQFKRLRYQEIDVIKDGNPANMHHKVFIIDGSTVITGSFNPSKGGDSKNDENILVIKDAKIAQLFEEEFEMVYLAGQK
jgi:phosphatidylserine/phosphatidylglycerophosphate/cardiolipin synthase-like enzyme